MLAWAGTTYDDSQIIPGGYSITGDDLNAAHNFGRTVTNDRDAYIAQLDHFYSLTSLRGTIDAAKSVPLDGYAQANVDAFNTAIANAQKTVSNKTATIDATDGAITAIANAQRVWLAGTSATTGTPGTTPTMVPTRAPILVKPTPLVPRTAHPRTLLVLSPCRTPVPPSSRPPWPRWYCCWSA